MFGKDSGIEDPDVAVGDDEAGPDIRIPGGEGPDVIGGHDEKSRG